MIKEIKNFEIFFRLLSYLTVLCGFLSLWVSGTFGLLTSALFISVIISAWFLENSRWQISEKLGTVLIVVALPLFYLGWKFRLLGFSGTESMIAGMLARLILSLTAIKLLQKKSDRDWVFLYLMSFFQVLLAAGLSISSLYLASLLIYLLVVICAVIAFEIRKTAGAVGDKQNANAPINSQKNSVALLKAPARYLPLTAISLIFLISVLATPMFFLLPRVGGAGLGGSQSGVSTLTGFSDSVSLGDIGEIQQNDQIVMRVRIEPSDYELSDIRWRGVALDTFDNKSWRKSRAGSREVLEKDETGFFRIPATSGRGNFVVQTVYLEPLDTPVLFSLLRPAVVQGNFSMLIRDPDGALSFQRNNFERISYKVMSDVTLPVAQSLRIDDGAYPAQSQRYLQLPETIDERIAQFAARITARANNRYDKAKAVETYLQNNFGYTLEQKAGTDQPLADFLFNIREGHCEYFATAMAVMLRTQGIATRVVNGFQQGEYNETADVFVVRQRNAHSWVEVYFPETNVWVPFDPTPFAGQNLGDGAIGIAGQFNKYLEAFETFWIQYFVAYDNQEQRSLFRSVKNSFQDYQTKTSSWLDDRREQLSDWWREVRGDKGFETSAKAIGFGIGYLIASVFGIILVIWLYRKIIKLKIWQNILAWLKRKNETTIIEFYERMQRILASKGFRRQPHQTPLEFAFALKMPEAVSITEKYNRVRFGEKSLSKNEAEEIENWLEKIESANNE